METKIVIAGDVVVSYHHADEQLKATVVDEKIAKIIKNSDYSLVNFEVTIQRMV